jgi:hypothetical protein
MDDDSTPIGPIGEIMQAPITVWQIWYALAKEALLKCLKPADLVKVLSFRKSAAAIWTHLKQKYGRPLDYEYIRINNEYMRLRYTEGTPITEHIDRFNQLLQKLEYNRPSTISPLQPESVNLQFMTSLDDGWETFIMTKGDWICHASMAELYAEVRAMDARKTKPKPTTPTPLLLL